MTRKTRYILLLIGFLVFLVGAPAIVIYIRGLSFDPETGSFVSTGILAVRNEPRDAAVYLDGELIREGEGDIKFLRPKEYTLTLRKAEYYEWSKRLAIKPNEVTWAQGASDAIHLIYRDTGPVSVASGVSNFDVWGDNVVYGTGNSVIVSPINSLNNSHNLQLGHDVQNFFPSSDRSQYVVTSATSGRASLIDVHRRSVADISPLITPESQLIFSPSNQLYVLENSRLYRTENVTTKVPVAEGVQAVAFQGDALYLLKNNATSSMLTFKQGNADEYTLASGLPLFGKADVIVNFQKEIFVIGDGRLYKMGARLEQLADNISFWSFDPRNDSLLVAHSGEISYYNNFQKRLELITRSSSPVTSPVFAPGINYSFFVRDNSIFAIEGGNHGQQNQYTLYQSPTLRTIALGPNSEYLYFLDDTTLKRMRVR